MKFGASVRNRQFIVRLDKGEDFIETLRLFFQRERLKTCVFWGHGEFSKCALQAFNPDRRLMETIFTSDSFVSVPVIKGNITLMGNEIIVQSSCVLNYRPCGQLHTVAGFVQQAKVFSAELHLTAFEDLKVNRAFDTITGQVPMTQFKSSYDEYGSNSISSIGAAAEVSSLDESALGLSGLTASQSQIPNPEIVRRRSRVAMDPSEASGFAFQDMGEQSALPKRRSRKAIEPSQNPELGESTLGSDNSQLVTSSVQPEDSAIPTTSRRVKASVKAAAPKAEEKACLIQKGDWLRHPSLGICLVENLLPSNCVQILPDGGSLRDISLSYFKAVQCEDYAGARCFVLERI